ncbi:uncharacterized protein LOC120709931 [Panicum virgatum]|uniref:uncharacterized protein LOC120709931 n=1 Tax=Panicum virgatum TaxID=38727 RepID=UPI0019D68234|nr:uncharacterized protein LOC120709931 [Panicum virgatum]
MDDFTLRLQNIVAVLETVGETIPQCSVVEKLLRVVPKSLRQVAIAIQVTANLSTLTQEDASGRLRAAQECDAEDDSPPSPRADGKLYLTQEQWEARADEEEGTLLMARVTSIQISPSPRAAQVNVPLPLTKEQEEGGLVQLVEAKVLAQLDGDGPAADALWYLNTGTTNHMSGSRAVFSDLDRNVAGTVRFGDESVVKIEGRGTVLFSCKNGEHRQLNGVYFISRLDTNIISVGQLDEEGHDVHIRHGVMRIRDEQRRLLARVRRSPTRVYTICLDIARPISAWPGSRGGARSRRRAVDVLDLVHGDICGPITPMTLSGNRYFLLLVNDMSRYMWLCLLASKDQAPAAIRRFKAVAEVESGRKL